MEYLSIQKTLDLMKNSVLRSVEENEQHEEEIQTLLPSMVPGSLRGEVAEDDAQLIDKFYLPHFVIVPRGITNHLAEDGISKANSEETASLISQFPAKDAQYTEGFRQGLSTSLNPMHILYGADDHMQPLDLSKKRQPDPLNKNQAIEREVSDGVRKRSLEYSENEEGRQKGRQVSKPLMETLWAHFKTQRPLSPRDCYRLSFEFSLVDKQISKWFKKKEKKYEKFCKKAIHHSKYRYLWLSSEDQQHFHHLYEENFLKKKKKF